MLMAHPSQLHLFLACPVQRLQFPLCVSLGCSTAHQESSQHRATFMFLSDPWLAPAKMGASSSGGRQPHAEHCCLSTLASAWLALQFPLGFLLRLS